MTTGKEVNKAKSVCMATTAESTRKQAVYPPETEANESNNNVLTTKALRLQRVYLLVRLVVPWDS